MNNDKIVHGAERKEALAAVVGLFSLCLSLRQRRLLMCASCARPLPAVGLLEFFNVPLCGYFEVWRNWISFGRRLQKRAQMHLLFDWQWKNKVLVGIQSGLVQKIQITDGSNFCVCAHSPTKVLESGAEIRGNYHNKNAWSELHRPPIKVDDNNCRAAN
jgi:hypothetical protein